MARSIAGGALMGLANLVPGVSGGTMLLAVGLYPQFIAGVAEASTLKLRAPVLLMLACVGGSAVLAIAGGARAIGAVLDRYPWVMYSLFIGLAGRGHPDRLAPRAAAGSHGRTERRRRRGGHGPAGLPRSGTRQPRRGAGAGDLRPAGRGRSVRGRGDDPSRRLRRLSAAGARPVPTDHRRRGAGRRHRPRGRLGRGRAGAPRAGPGDGGDGGRHRRREQSRAAAPGDAAAGHARLPARTPARGGRRPVAVHGTRPAPRRRRRGRAEDALAGDGGGTATPRTIRAGAPCRRPDRRAAVRCSCSPASAPPGAYPDSAPEELRSCTAAFGSAPNPILAHLSSPDGSAGCPTQSCQ